MCARPVRQGSHVELSIARTKHQADQAHEVQSTDPLTRGLRNGLTDTAAWQAWSTTQNQLWQLRQPAPPLVFPGEEEIFLDMYTQVREEEQIISPPYTRIQQDVSMRGRKKRKQGEDNALIG